MTKCKKCKKEFDPQYNVCPHCGTIVRNRKNVFSPQLNFDKSKQTVLAVLAAIAIVVLLLTSILMALGKFQVASSVAQTTVEATTEAVVGMSLAEIYALGKTPLVVGAEYTAEIPYGQVASIEGDPTQNRVEVVLSLGAEEDITTVEGNYLFRDAAQVKSELDTLEITYQEIFYFVENLKENIVFAQEISSDGQSVELSVTVADDSYPIGELLPVAEKDIVLEDVEDSELTIDDNESGKDDVAEQVQATEIDLNEMTDYVGENVCFLMDAVVASDGTERQFYVERYVLSQQEENTIVNQVSYTGNIVGLEVSLGAQATIQMPNLIGTPYTTAVTQLVALGVDEESIVLLQSNYITAYDACVTMSFPSAGEEITVDDKIYLIYYG